MGKAKFGKGNTKYLYAGKYYFTFIQTEMFSSTSGSLFQKSMSQYGLLLLTFLFGALSFRAVTSCVRSLQ